MIPAQDIARYFLGTFDEESGDNISNLKLQKLLYYAQGFHLAMQEGRRLFPEALEAWEHGPVVRPLYHRYKVYKWGAIDRPENFDIDEYLPETRELLDAVYNVYGQYTPTRLERMTHEEPPWIETPRDQEIPIESIRDYFTTLVEEGRSDKAVTGHPVWPTNSFRFQRRRSIEGRLRPHRDKLRAITRRVADSPDPWAGDDD